MSRAFLYALRFVALAAVFGFVTAVVVGSATRSTVSTGLAVTIVNVFVLFSQIDRFVDAKLAAESGAGR